MVNALLKKLKYINVFDDSSCKNCRIREDFISLQNNEIAAVSSVASVWRSNLSVFSVRLEGVGMATVKALTGSCPALAWHCTGRALGFPLLILNAASQRCYEKYFWVEFNSAESFR